MFHCWTWLSICCRRVRSLRCRRCRKDSRWRPPPGSTREQTTAPHRALTISGIFCSQYLGSLMDGLQLPGRHFRRVHRALSKGGEATVRVEVDLLWTTMLQQRSDLVDNEVDRLDLRRAWVAHAQTNFFIGGPTDHNPNNGLPTPGVG